MYLPTSSFETLAEFIIGPRFARTRWQAPHQVEIRSRPDSRASEIFKQRLRQNNPTGKSAKAVQPFAQKYSA
jgi:hypothetical protein